MVQHSFPGGLYWCVSIDYQFLRSRRWINPICKPIPVIYFIRDYTLLSRKCSKRKPLGDKTPHSASKECAPLQFGVRFRIRSRSRSRSRGRSRSTAQKPKARKGGERRGGRGEGRKRCIIPLVLV
nr:hypothetical protein [Lentinula edodes]